ncbi:hypothetical protein D0U04_26700 [Bacillus clarus]|uniref:DUF4046 domain-containing protein n=1 Tax=Bacillus clarus TaxID=2338372 RepID=A0A090YA98_9BACI|nr:hypothetical protein [Bacillus clarus]KFM95066.1 hypothetical protein DJ93_5812 [Bacillus clarus]RFT62936.1 hypothetical protein D0U04_26700 [Bacillus clarus]
MSSTTIEEIYQEILDGKRNRFPTHTWSVDVNGELAKRVTKYLIEKVLKWDTDDIKTGWNQKLIMKFRLTGTLHVAYHGSPYAMLNDLYPGRFKEWELKVAPLGFWTKEKALEALRWTIEEKEQLTDEQIKNLYNINWLAKKGLRTPVQKFWSDSPYAMLNTLYPGRFKEWELNATPNNFWTKGKALKALRWAIEEKEQLTDKTQIKKLYSRRWLKQQKLMVPLNKFWKNSPYAMLNELYPGRFKEWELNVTPNNFWTEQTAIDALRWVIEEKEQLTDEQLLETYTAKWLKKQGLQAPLDKYWNTSPYAMLNDLYPNRFSKEMLKGYKNSSILSL